MDDLSYAFAEEEEVLFAEPVDYLERAEDPAAIAHEQRVRAEQQAQFKALKKQSQALFGQVKGLPGVRTAEQWAGILEEAGDSIGNGNFLVQQLGADRYLDYKIVAVLLTLRQNLIAELPRATAAQIMMIDVAVVSYYNFFRVQGWIGNLSLVVEADLFGQGFSPDHCDSDLADKVQEQIRRLGEHILPLQDRASRMILRALGALPQSGNPASSPKRRPARAFE